MNSLMRGLLLAGVAAGLAAPAAAQEGAAFFNGRTVEYVVATNPGGGYDTYGRLVAEYMQKHLPGSTFIVRNMPGAGHIIGANHIYASEPNGLTIGTFNTALVYTQLAEVSGVRFDLGEMSWIGKAASDPRVLLMSTQSGIASMEELLSTSEEIRYGASGLGSSDYLDMVLLQRALDLPGTVINGYGGNENELGMMRGEIHGAVGSRSSYAPFVRDGNGVFIGQVGGSETDVPQLDRYVTSEFGDQILALMETQSEVVRITVGPPGIPEDRLDALRDAFEKAMADPELLARAEQLNIPIDPLVGAQLGEEVQSQFDVSPEIVDLLKELLN